MLLLLLLLLQPHAITSKRMGVGACAWEGEMLLAAYLLSECVTLVTVAAQLQMTPVKAAGNAAAKTATVECRAMQLGATYRYNAVAPGNRNVAVLTALAAAVAAAAAALLPVCSHTPSPLHRHDSNRAGLRTWAGWAVGCKAGRTGALVSGARGGGGEAENPRGGSKEREDAVVVPESVSRATGGCVEAAALLPKQPCFEAFSQHQHG
jgi:hypothetical protein